MFLLRACAAAREAMVMLHMMLSPPTATMVSAAPDSMSIQATVTASMPEEQAVFTVRLGPRMLLAMAI